MDNPYEWRIIQVIPATGWVAEHGDEHGVFHEPLIAWALVEEPEDKSGPAIRFMAGIEASGDPGVATWFSAMNAGFKRYLFLPDRDHAAEVVSSPQAIGA